MSNITLVGKEVARVGFIFTYVGTSPECEDCQVKKACHGLKAGYRYRITAIRDKEHDCPVHYGGKVVIAEYEELKVEVSIPSSKAIEGMMITLKDNSCPLVWCANHHLCMEKNPASGKKVKVIKLMKEMNCPRGLKLRRAEVELPGKGKK